MFALVSATVHRTVAFEVFESRHTKKKKAERADAHSAFLVRVSRFELEAMLHFVRHCMRRMPPLAPRFARTARGWQSRGLEFARYCKRKRQETQKHFLSFWSECRDSNSRPLEPHSSAIPNFATPGFCLSFPDSLGIISHLVRKCKHYFQFF